MPDTFDENDFESFDQFLRFLLFEHGAYPHGSPEKAGEQWVQADFARRVGSSERLVRYWLKDEKSPRDLRPIERALFGTNKKYEQWRMLLRKLNQSPRNGLAEEANASPGDEGGSTSEPPPAQILHPEIRPVVSFTGRADQLAAIDAALWQGSGSAALTNSAAIHGLGGVGKTVLAREYGWRNQARYRGV
jgi:hypothetical protein